MIRIEDCVKVGQVSKTHNLQGAVIVTTTNSLLEKYRDEPVFILLDGRPVPFFIAPDGLTVRNPTSCIVKFNFVDTLQQAERLIGAEILLEATRVRRRDMESEEFCPSQWVGFLVADVNTGKTGNMWGIDNYSGNIVMTIDILGKKILLPFASKYILHVDFKAKKITVNIPQDIFDLY